MQAQEHRSRQADPETRVDQSMQRCRTQRSEPQHLSIRRRQLHRCGSYRDQDPNRHVLEPTPDVLQRARGALVQPLLVVDRDEHRAVAGKRPEDTTECREDRATLGRARGRLRDQEGDVDGMALRVWKRLDMSAFHRGEQVCEAGVRKCCFRFRRPADEYVVVALNCRGDGGPPDSRLPNAGLPFDHQAAGMSRDVVNEAVDPRELLVPSDNVSFHVAASVGGRLDRRQHEYVGLRPRGRAPRDLTNFAKARR